MAITIRKERNLVYLQSDSQSKPYKVDLSNGRLYGIKGAPLSATPTTLRNEHWNIDNESDILSYRLQTYICNGSFKSASRYIQDLAIYEKLAALNSPYLRYCRLTSSQMQRIENNWNAICKAINSLTAITYLNELSNTVAYASWKNDKGIVVDEHITEPMIKAIYKYHSNWSKEQVHRALYYLSKGLWEYHHSSEAINRIDIYFDYCDKLGEAPSKGDFMRLYVETKRKYELRKAEYDDKAIAKYQNSVADKLAFEDDNFIVIIPTTADEIRNEGETQHNCVGRLYLPKVIDKTTHIVFIRQKNVPNASYITCEVDNYGEVNQYLLAYNRWVNDNTPEAEFKKAYKEHLKKVW